MKGERGREEAAASSGPAEQGGMPIKIRCKCGVKLKLSSDKAGKKIRCPYCNYKFRVLIQDTAAKSGAKLTGSRPVPAEDAPTVLPEEAGPVILYEDDSDPSEPLTEVDEIEDEAEDDAAIDESTKPATPGPDIDLNDLVLCHYCTELVPRGAEQCHHCNYHFKKGMVVGPSREEMDREAASSAMTVDGQVHAEYIPCHYCTEPIPKDADPCPHCNYSSSEGLILGMSREDRENLEAAAATKLAEHKQAEETLPCHNCMAPILQGTVECPECHYSVVEGRIVSKTDEEIQLEADAEQMKPEGDTKTKTPCPHCQENIDPGIMVCEHCGFNLTQGELVSRMSDQARKDEQREMARDRMFSLLYRVLIVGFVFLMGVCGSHARLTITAATPPLGIFSPLLAPLFLAFILPQVFAAFVGLVSGKIVFMALYFLMWLAATIFCWFVVAFCSSSLFVNLNRDETPVQVLGTFSPLFAGIWCVFAKRHALSERQLELIRRTRLAKPEQGQTFTKISQLPKCPSCKGAVPPGSKRCILCGYDVTQPVEAEPKRKKLAKPAAAFVGIAIFFALLLNTPLGKRLLYTGEMRAVRVVTDNAKVTSGKLSVVVNKGDLLGFIEEKDRKIKVRILGEEQDFTGWLPSEYVELAPGIKLEVTPK